MSQIVLELPPPEYWQDFERMTQDICKLTWNDPFTQKNGRQGQKQSGVDVYGYDYIHSKMVGVQCKKKRSRRGEFKSRCGGTLNRKNIIDEMKKAEEFEPPLDLFIISTTELRDVNLQKEVRLLNQERKKRKKFLIDIWFWENYEQIFNENISILYSYYSDVLKANKSYNPDKHILLHIHKAFSRPAFDTPFHLENNCVDFLDAISDTQAAIRTGRIRSRKDDSIISSSYPYTKLSKKKWKNIFDSVLEQLQDIRDYFTLILQQGGVKQCRPNCMCITDRQATERLNVMRRDVLIEINLILKEADLDMIKSRLILKQN